MNEARETLLMRIEEMWSMAWNYSICNLLENVARLHNKFISKDDIKGMTDEQWLNWLSDEPELNTSVFWDPDREPGRVAEVMRELKGQWDANPDMTLGTLLFAAVDRYSLKFSLYSIEDDQLLRGLRAMGLAEKAQYRKSFG
ncbi:uncharacterized protein YihD (DUF1040 family) [Paenibacillus mucilaginosus]|uniref:hypothetical protein n=1 Tax=Paenibacillus mucilaginosus TaxID=61624 RepID=UPI003D1F0437